MKKKVLFILVYLLFAIFAYSQTSGDITYNDPSTPDITYTFNENSSWSLTWTYYYINWYRVGGVKIYTYPGLDAVITDIGLSKNYGIWHGYWNWSCSRCSDHGTTPCVVHPCAGTLTTVYPDRNLDYDEYIQYSIINSNSSSIIKPTYIDSNTNQRIYNGLTIDVEQLYSSGVPWDYPNKPGGSGDGPVLVNHIH